MHHHPAHGRTGHIVRHAAGPLLAICLILTAGCRNRPPVDLGDAAQSLYERSVLMTRAYIDSMRHTNDSAAWERLSKAYDDRMARLNFEYPADTDLYMSEGQNDTMYIMTQAFAHARRLAWRRITHPDDTVRQSADSAALTLPHPHTATAPAARPPAVAAATH